MSPKKLAQERPRWPYFVKRVLAFALDFFIISRLAIIVAALAYGFINQGQIEVVHDLSHFTSQQALIIVAVIFLVNLFYFVYIPVYLWPGQTPAMKLLQLKIVGEGGEPLSLWPMAKRFVVGCLLLEGAFYDLGGLLRTPLINYLWPHASVDFLTMLNFVISGVAVVSVLLALWNKKGQTGHDLIAKSQVVDLYQGGQGAL